MPDDDELPAIQPALKLRQNSRGNNRLRGNILLPLTNDEDRNAAPAAGQRQILTQQSPAAIVCAPAASPPDNRRQLQYCPVPCLLHKRR
jgi:hypothetical protein